MVDCLLWANILFSMWCWEMMARQVEKGHKLGSGPSGSGGGGWGVMGIGGGVVWSFWYGRQWVDGPGKSKSLSAGREGILCCLMLKWRERNTDGCRLAVGRGLDYELGADPVNGGLPPSLLYLPHPSLFPFLLPLPLPFLPHCLMPFLHFLFLSSFSSYG